MFNIIINKFVSTAINADIKDYANLICDNIESFIKRVTEIKILIHVEACKL